MWGATVLTKNSGFCAGKSLEVPLSLPTGLGTAGEDYYDCTLYHQAFTPLYAISGERWAIRLLIMAEHEVLCVSVG